jgi:hypothetical protein
MLLALVQAGSGQNGQEVCRTQFYLEQLTPRDFVGTGVLYFSRGESPIILKSASCVTDADDYCPDPDPTFEKVRIWSLT